MTSQFTPPALQDFLKSKAFRAIPQTEERRLFERARAGDAKARARLIEANTRFAAAVARNYLDRGLDMVDLTSEAILGLARAVDRFDHTTEYKFITYAVWWIRQGILKAISDQSRAYRVPPSLVAAYGKIERHRRHLEQGGGRAVSLPAIAESMGVSLDHVEEAVSSLAQPYYMDFQPLEEYDSTFEGLLADPGADAEAPAREGMDGRYTRKLLGRLDPRSAAVLRRYYGLDGLPEATLQEIADDMEITRERVRQIKDKAEVRLALYARNLKLPPDQQKAIIRRPKETATHA